MQNEIKKTLAHEVTSSDMEEILTLINGYYNFDMSGYSQPSLRRRFIRLMNRKNMNSIYELKYALINHKISSEELTNELTVNVTEMFRDPEFFKALRKDVIPYLKTFPHFKVWHAGCSTGEEMYSLAILLKEEGILSRCQQYGTDINSQVLENAEKGIYDLKDVKKYTLNYQESGCNESFSNYYAARYGKIKMNPELSMNMTFAMHNLVSDASFNEFQLIICRNVLIYFDREAQARSFKLFSDSLCHNGYLGIGMQESIIQSQGDKSFKAVNRLSKIFSKKTN